MPDIEQEAYVALLEAPVGIKYTRLYHINVNVSTGLRYYFKPNEGVDHASMYVQSGLRIGHNLWTDFTYRDGGNEQEMNLQPYSNAIIYQGEFLIGFKGDFFKNFVMLNSSSIGLIYQFNGIFQSEGTSSISPVHITWRLMF